MILLIIRVALWVHSRVMWCRIHDSSFERKRNTIMLLRVCVLRDNHVQGGGYPKRMVNAIPTIFRTTSEQASPAPYINKTTTLHDLNLKERNMSYDVLDQIYVITRKREVSCIIEWILCSGHNESIRPLFLHHSIHKEIGFAFAIP